MKTAKRDLIFSEALVPLSTISTGVALFLFIKVSWLLFPFLIIAVLPFGFSCLGLERLHALREKLRERQNE